MLVTLLADAVPLDALSGSSGWAGAGLLGLVLAWLLLVYLPSKDKQQSGSDAKKDEQLAKKDAQITLLVESTERKLAAQQAAFSAALAQVVQHCKDEGRELMNQFRWLMAQRPAAPGPPDSPFRPRS